MNVPDWTPIILAGIGALATMVAAYFTSRAAGKAAAQKEHDALAVRVATARELASKAREEAAAAKAQAAAVAEDAHAAAMNAQWAGEELKRHEREESQRRKDAREAGQQRDRQIADWQKEVRQMLVEQGQDIAEIRGSLGGRRGR